MIHMLRLSPRYIKTCNPLSIVHKRHICYLAPEFNTILLLQYMRYKPGLTAVPALILDPVYLAIMNWPGNNI